MVGSCVHVQRDVCVAVRPSSVVCRDSLCRMVSEQFVGWCTLSISTCFLVHFSGGLTRCCLRRLCAGPILTKLGKLTRAPSIDMSKNQLSGEYMLRLRCVYGRVVFLDILCRIDDSRKRGSTLVAEWRPGEGVAYGWFVCAGPAGCMRGSAVR